jgi:uncharacterized protein (DUF1501 family)
MQKQICTRRIFLQKGLTLLAVAPTVPTFINQTVFALANPMDVALTQQPSGRDGKILVVVQLSGGNDGLSTIVPYADDAYQRVRGGLAHEAKSVLKIDNYMGMHPNLAPLKEMFDSGRMSIVQGVGYPNPNRSHFRSMDIWQSGDPEQATAANGWIGRFFDNACPGCDPHVGVSIGDTLPLAMQGRRVTPLSFSGPENYRYNGPDVERYLALNHRPAAGGERRAADGRGGGAEREALDFLHRTAMDAQLSSDQILSMTRGHQTRAEYPRTRFGNGLRTVAAMIRGGLATRVYYVSLGGFDTHANQRGPHDRLMGELAQGVAAFWQDMAEQKNDERVLMMSFSEFGRRVQANGSGGTDHGAAAPMFLFGPRVREGVVGRHPSLTDLYQGDLKHNIDFRSVYATVLQRWLETPSRPVLGRQFELLTLVKG